MAQEFDIVAEAKKIFDKEIDALNKTKDSLDDSFKKVVELMVNCRGKVILTGMGKPGHIGTKIAATLSSLGTSSFFMHPGEALHGDLGMVEKNDLVILMSYSGESDEITRLMPTLHQIGCTTVAITGKPESTLSRECQYHIFFPPFEEACYMHLAPTSSTTALLVLGDALALTASQVKKYTKEDFGIHHPAGALGKKLLVRVGDIMHKDDENAVVFEHTSLGQAIVEMSTKCLNTVTVISEESKLVGFITDNDLCKALNSGIDVYTESVESIMSGTSNWVNQDDLAVNALKIMKEQNETAMPVLDENKKVVGTILIQDIFKAGILS